jgi:glutathione S-transferase
MITVHHLNNSRSQRVLWLLEELEVPYTVKRYERDRTTMLAPPELKQVHPLGKSPVIEDGGRVYAESGAIVEYLAETYGGRLVPKERDARERYRYWMHFAEGSMMTPLLLKLYAGRVGEAGAPLAERADGQLALLLGFVEADLGEAPFFAGAALSAADVQMSFPLEAAAARGGLNAKSYPRLSAFLDRIHARPAYQRALERGGPYEILR